MSDLPPNWAEAPIGDLVIFGPRNDCEDDTEVGFVPLHRLGTTYLAGHTFERKLWRDVKNGYSHFADGDVLLARITPSFENGKAGVARNLPSGIGAGSTEYFVFRPPAAEFLAEYLLAHFKSSAFLGEGEKQMSGASGQQRVPKSYVLNNTIRVAPPAEQERIVAKLTGILARVDACRNRVDRVPELLRRFREAVISAATSGDLTADWRAGGNANSLGEWVESPLQDLCEPDRIITYGVVKLGPEFSNGVPCLRTSNVRPLRFDLEGLKRIAPVKSAEYMRTILRGGEVLVNVRGTLGGVAVVESHMAGWNISREVAVVPVDQTRADSTYLAYWIASARSQRWLRRVEKGVAYVGVNIEDLRRLPVELPPIAEQQEIVARVRGLLSTADELEARFEGALTRIQRIASAVIDKAFRGELVSQDPTDPPAAVLVERMKAAKESYSAARRSSNSKRPPMPKLSADLVKQVISEMPENRFSFADLRQRVPGEYEPLRAILFKLLADSNPPIKQVFDQESKSMQFEAITP